MSAAVRRVLDPPEDSPGVQAVLDATRLRLELRSWQGADQVVAGVAVEPAGTYALLASFVRDEVVQSRGLSTGPVEHLVDELMRLIPPAPDDPRHPGPPTPLLLDDLLLLRDLVRQGDEDLAAAAVADFGLTGVPGWVRDLATLTGGVTTSLTRPSAPPAILHTCTATAAGWLRMSTDAEGFVRATPLTHRELREGLLDAAMLALLDSAA